MQTDGNGAYRQGQMWCAQSFAYGATGEILADDNKASFGAEAAEGLRQLAERLNAIGYKISNSRGDYEAARNE